MSGYIWSFIAIFMIHEMEEVFGLPDWINANMPMLCEKYPFFAKQYRYCSNRGFTAAVYEELILFAAVCLFSELNGIYGAWFGLVAGFAVHLLMHLVMAAIVRKYIPSVITSVLMLAPSLYILAKSIPFIDFAASKTLITIAAVIIAAAANIPVSHMLMRHISLRDKQRREP